MQVCNNKLQFIYLIKSIILKNNLQFDLYEPAFIDTLLFFLNTNEH